MTVFLYLWLQSSSSSSLISSSLHYHDLYFFHWIMLWRLCDDEWVTKKKGTTTETNKKIYTEIILYSYLIFLLRKLFKFCINLVDRFNAPSIYYLLLIQHVYIIFYTCTSILDSTMIIAHHHRHHFDYYDYMMICFNSFIIQFAVSENNNEENDNMTPAPSSLTTVTFFP